MWLQRAGIVLVLVLKTLEGDSFLVPRNPGQNGKLSTPPSPPSSPSRPSNTAAAASTTTSAETDTATTTTTTASNEEDVYHPPEEYFESGPHHLETMEEYKEMYERSIKDPQAFWGEIAKEFHWYEPWDVDHHHHNFDRTKGRVSTSFFKGGKTNICYNALDRHVRDGDGDRVAFYTERNELEKTGVHYSPDSYTYAEALKEVNRLANVLKGLGVKKGDKVSIFLPMVAELPLSMLACSRIGAVHSVVFAGFSKEALAGRIMDAGAKVVITCDGVFRGTKLVPLYNTMEQALEICKEKGLEVAGTVVLQRVGPEISKIKLKEGRDQYWHEAVRSVPDTCPVEIMDAEDPLFILYTSGSTGKPKGVVHTIGGYMIMTATTFKHVFNFHSKGGDVWFCTADCGWITGHSYVAYGPTLLGATQVVFEGVPSFPDVSRLWKIVDKYNVSHLYTAPTAIRSLMREGDHHVKSSSRKSLRMLGSVGEPINPDAWKWYHRVVGDGHCPVADTWWQTETGGIMIAPIPVRGFVQKPGSATLPFFGVRPVLLDPQGNELHGPAEGMLAIKSAWPSTIRTIHGDHDRLESTYFSYPGCYLTGDNARRDKDGYYYITGRADDVIIVSGHNVGSAEVESALTTHPAVAEAAVVGRPHDVKGNCLYCFVTLKKGQQTSAQLEQELRGLVRSLVGAFASPDFLHWAPRLPKTRSGKIMRRILRKIAAAGDVVNTEDLGDTSTLAEPDVVQELIDSRP